MNNTTQLRSHPLPLFFGVLNVQAKPFIPKPVKPTVPKFTAEQMAQVFRIQQEELEEEPE